MRTLLVFSLIVMASSASAELRRRRAFFSNGQSQVIPRSTSLQQKSVVSQAKSAPETDSQSRVVQDEEGRYYTIHSKFTADPGASDLKFIASDVLALWNEENQAWDYFPEDTKSPLKRVEAGPDGRWYTVRYFRENGDIRREVFSVWHEDGKWQKINPLVSREIKIAEHSSANPQKLKVDEASAAKAAISDKVAKMDAQIAANAPSAQDLSYRHTAIAQTIARQLAVPKARPVADILTQANLNDGAVQSGGMVIDHMAVASHRAGEKPTLVIRLDSENQEAVAKTIADFKSAMVHAVLKNKSGSLIKDVFGTLAVGGNLANLGKGPQLDLRILIDASKDVESGYQAYLNKLKEIPAISGAVAAHQGYQTRGRETDLANRRLARGGAILGIVQSKIDAGIAEAAAQIRANPKFQNAETLASSYLAARLEEGIRAAILEIAKTNPDSLGSPDLGVGVITHRESSDYLARLIGSGNLGIELPIDNGERIFFAYEANGSIRDWAQSVAKLLAMVDEKPLRREDVVAIEQEYRVALSKIEPRLESPAAKANRGTHKN